MWVSGNIYLTKPTASILSPQYQFRSMCGSDLPLVSEWSVHTRNNIPCVIVLSTPWPRHCCHYLSYILLMSDTSHKSSWLIPKSALARMHEKGKILKSDFIVWVTVTLKNYPSKVWLWRALISTQKTLWVQSYEDMKNTGLDITRNWASSPEEWTQPIHRGIQLRPVHGSKLSVAHIKMNMSHLLRELQSEGRANQKRLTTAEG